MKYHINYYKSWKSRNNTRPAQWDDGYSSSIGKNVEQFKKNSIVCGPVE